jgi:hypothetical protein
MVVMFGVRIGITMSISPMTFLSHQRIWPGKVIVRFATVLVSKQI